MKKSVLLGFIVVMVAVSCLFAGCSTRSEAGDAMEQTAAVKQTAAAKQVCEQSRSHFLFSLTIRSPGFSEKTELSGIYRNVSREISIEYTREGTYIMCLRKTGQAV
jgi:predicted small secreted protein